MERQLNRANCKMFSRRGVSIGMSTAKMPRYTIKIPPQQEIPFFTAYGIYLFFAILNTSFFAKYIMNVYGAILWLCFAILAVPELHKIRYTGKELIKALFAISFSVYAYIFGGGSFAVIFIFLYCGRKIDFKKIARFTIWAGGFAVAFVVISSFLGIIQNVVVMHKGYERFSLGFRYGLYAPCYLFNFTALAVYIKGFKIRWGQILLLFLLNYGMYLLANARLSFFMVILVLLAASVMKCWPNILAHMKVVCFLLSLSYVVIGLFSIYAAVKAGCSWAEFP